MCPCIKWEMLSKFQSQRGEAGCMWPTEEAPPPPHHWLQAIQNTRMTHSNQCRKNSSVTKSHGSQAPFLLSHKRLLGFQPQLTWWTKTSRGGSTGLPSLLVIEINPKPIRTLNHLQKPDPDRIWGWRWSSCSVDVAGFSPPPLPGPPATWTGEWRGAEGATGKRISKRDC